MKNRPWMLPLLVGAAARLIYLFCFPQREPHSDDLFYWHAAQSIAAGHGYGDVNGPSVSWMPGLSILLSGGVLIFGDSLLVARLIMVALSIVTIPAAWKLANVWLGERAARWTAWTFALFPAFWFYGSALFTENIAVLLVVLVLLWLSELKGGFEWKRALGVGLCWSGLLYVKPEFVFWPLLLGVGILWRQIALKTLLVMGFVGAILLVPWILRNERVFGEFIPLKANGGYLIWWVSLDPPVEATDERTAEEVAIESSFIVPGKPGATGKNAAHAGIERLKQHPFRYLKLCFTRRLVHLFLGSQTEPANAVGLARSFGDLRASHENLRLAIKLLMFVLQGLICGIGIVGVLLFAPNWIRVLFLGMVGTYIMLLGIPRYSMVLMPMLIPYGAALLERLRPSPSLR